MSLTKKGRIEFLDGFCCECGNLWELPRELCLRPDLWELIRILDALFFSLWELPRLRSELDRFGIVGSPTKRKDLLVFPGD